LIHVEDETLVVIDGKDKVVHETHAVSHLALNFHWQMLQLVCAHSINQ